MPLPLALLLADAASAQSIPRRQIPPSVLAELADLERRFEAALATDCHPDLCYSKGCAYGDHAVVDRPRATSMPGLGGEPGPGSVEPQEFLTRATCAFAYEPTVTPEDAEALSRRLQSRMTHAFTSVSVSRQELEPVPPELERAPLPPAPETPPAPPPAPPPSWTRELWTTLLPHVGWMIALAMSTAAATVLFWAWRRVGKETIEEKAMLAEIAREAALPPAPPEPAELEPDDEADEELAAEAEAWKTRLAGARPDAPDPELEGMVRELLRARDLPTLARAVLAAPTGFLASFPAGGDVAAAKLELAEYLKRVDPAELPSDEAFFRTLSRMARAAALSGQPDAKLLRGLREDFGAAGLVTLFGQVPARTGALLFAHAPLDQQLEMVRLLPHERGVELAEQLLRSGRMDDAEAAYLFGVLGAARAGQPLPEAPRGGVSERGSAFEVAGPLSVLLGALPAVDRQELLGDAVRRFHGTLPSVYRGLVYADLLRGLPDAQRADLFLAVDADRLAAWLQLQDEVARAGLLQGLPRALRASLESAPAMSRDRQLALAEQARGELARGLERVLAREGRTFEQLVAGGEA